MWAATSCLGGNRSPRLLHEWYLLIREADGLSASSLTWLKAAFKDLLDFCEAEGFPADLAALDSGHLTLWLVNLRKRRSKRNPEQPLRQNTLNCCWRGVKNFYRWAADNDKLASDPARGIKGPRAVRPKTLTYQEHHISALL